MQSPLDEKEDFRSISTEGDQDANDWHRFTRHSPAVIQAWKNPVEGTSLPLLLCPGLAQHGLHDALSVEPDVSADQRLRAVLDECVWQR